MLNLSKNQKAIFLRGNIMVCITEDPVETFNLNDLKSFGPMYEGMYLEMIDRWGEKYRKPYNNIVDLHNDCAAIAKRFQTGRY